MLYLERLFSFQLYSQRGKMKQITERILLILGHTPTPLLYYFPNTQIIIAKHLPAMRTLSSLLCQPALRRQKNKLALIVETPLF